MEKQKTKIIKKSSALLFILFVSAIFYFWTDNIIERILLKINLTILCVGYFIVKQLEENKD